MLEVDLNEAVIEKFGGSFSGISSPSSKPVHAKATEDRPNSTSSVACMAPKAISPCPSGADDDRGGATKIEIVSIPKIGPDDPPATEQFAGGRGALVGVAISLGNRTRL
ncbi:hypothetical protein [Methylocystis sp.]|uniref:hypothetical protein n=1 Tax=Methylocystis sp. TaxID=1911079 RepID=UPI003DA24936